MASIAGWLAAVATLLGAAMAAANLGAKLTGYGFAMFTMGSAAWVANAALSGNTSLLFANLLLAMINLFGVWRWLGRKAGYEDGSARAARRSVALRQPALFSAAATLGAEVSVSGGETGGTLVDLMLHCEGMDLAYAVVAHGGAAGVGEQASAIAPQCLRFDAMGVSCLLDAGDIAALPSLDPENWPVTTPLRQCRAVPGQKPPG